VRKKTIIIVSLVVLILLLDQIFKIWIKTNMFLGQEIPLMGSWFKLHFVENEGMAFGMVFFDGFWGKLILSLFRLIASGCIGWIIYKMLKKGVPWGLLIAIALIFAGAIGNILDCVFYGRIFSADGMAILFPEGGGYAPILQGKVVDMLQFDLFTIHFPDGFPLWGGGVFNFFPAIFNIADSSITIGLFIMILFYYKSLSTFVASFESLKKKPEPEEEKV
jgi:signal peptidase II